MGRDPLYRGWFIATAKLVSARLRLAGRALGLFTSRARAGYRKLRPVPPKLVDFPGKLDQSVHSWMRSPLGEAVFKQEVALLEPMLKGLFGYHILQIGGSDRNSIIDSSPAGHKICFAPCEERAGGKRPQAVADNEELPLSSDSMDIVVIHHGLDFARDSHSLLREATRVLRPGGQLIVVGFNPLSSWGLSKLFRRKNAAPWCARFISRHRLLDWLKLLNLHVDLTASGVHFPPFIPQRFSRHIPGMDDFAQRIGSPLGGVYVIRCTKQIVPITPIITRWRPLRSPRGVIPAAENVRFKVH